MGGGGGRKVQALGFRGLGFRGLGLYRARSSDVPATKQGPRRTAVGHKLVLGCD